MPLDRLRHDPFRRLPTARPCQGQRPAGRWARAQSGGSRETMRGDQATVIFRRNGAGGKIPLTSAACDETLWANLPHCRYMGEAYGKRV